MVVPFGSAPRNSTTLVFMCARNRGSLTLYFLVHLALFTGTVYAAQDATSPANAAQQPAHDMHKMQMHGDHAMQMKANSFIHLIMQHATSGTDAEPISTP